MAAITISEFLVITSSFKTLWTVSPTQETERFLRRQPGFETGSSQRDASTDVCRRSGFGRYFGREKEDLFQSGCLFR